MRREIYANMTMQTSEEAGKYTIHFPSLPFYPKKKKNEAVTSYP